MIGFLRTTFTVQKFQGLFINTALGNFAGYVAGSLVTLLPTHGSRALLVQSPHVRRVAACIVAEARG